MVVIVIYLGVANVKLLLFSMKNVVRQIGKDGNEKVEEKILLTKSTRTTNHENL